MGNAEFEWNCIKMLDDFLNEEGLENEDFHIFVVWMCKILNNNKAMLSTDREGDSRYYEITYNGDKEEFYFDCYDKLINRCYNNKLEVV